jgi:DNA-binding NarL/FixJ family response regulator
MAIQQVFIIWSHPLFHESVRLLLKHPDVEIIGSTADHETARDDIERLRPDTVIVEEIGGGTHAEALAILDSSHFVPRVIGFSLDDNKLNVYRRQESTAARAEDLLSIVRSD